MSVTEFPGALPFLMMMAIGWLVPIAITVWALYTLHRLRVSQDATRATLERIEQLLQRR